MQLSDEKFSMLGGSVFNFNEIYERLKEFKQNFTKNRYTHSMLIRIYLYISDLWLPYLR